MKIVALNMCMTNSEDNKKFSYFGNEVNVHT